MTGKKILLLVISILCMLCLLAGCSKEPAVEAPKTVDFAAGSFEIDTTSQLAIVLQEGETQLLNNLPHLKTADFSGSECVEEIYNWAQSNPQVNVKYTVSLPDGTVLDSSAASIDLSGKSGADIRAAADMLRFLPKLESIELGAQRSGLGLEDIDYLHQACPAAVLGYAFELYGQQVNLTDSEINLSHIPVNDGGKAVMQAMAYMPNLTYLDMDSCGLGDLEMAAIRDAYPNVKVVWRIWFGDAYSVRTDVERILASQPSRGGMLTPENTQSLRYCTDVKYLDVGHNDALTDISFVGYMPKLEVAILAMCNWTDASALANCPNLEYLEMQTTLCTDLRPLAELKNLRHLNIAYNQELCDISPLYGLTELERLWIGCINPVPAEQVAQMQAAAPNCEINVEVYVDPVGGRWRYVDYNELAYMYIYHDRYILLREQFSDYASDAFSFYWNDPLL